MTSELASFSREFWRRIRFTLGRGRVTAVDDSGTVQEVQAQLNGFETRDGTPRLAEFGFTSNPPAGSDLVFVFLGGNRTSGVAIATNHHAASKPSVALCISSRMAAGAPRTLHQGSTKSRASTDRTWSRSSCS